MNNSKKEHKFKIFQWKFGISQNDLNRSSLVTITKVSYTGVDEFRGVTALHERGKTSFDKHGIG